MRNIEIKARLRDIESARKTAAAIATGGSASSARSTPTSIAAAAA